MVSKKIRKVGRKSKRKLRGGDTTGPTTVTGTAKMFQLGNKAISLTGPTTATVGVPTDYTVAAVTGYPAWDSDSYLSMSFLITDPTGTVTQVNGRNNSKTYTFDPKFAGKYTILAFAYQYGECFSENDCPTASMTVTVKDAPISTAPPTTTTGASKTFRFGDKAISITGPATTSVGVPTLYKVEPVKGYPEWERDQMLVVALLITDPTGNVTRDTNAKMYTFDPKFAGNYKFLAYAANVPECFNENDCPNVTMTVKVVASDSSASDRAAAQQKMDIFVWGIPDLMTWFDADDPNTGSVPPADGANIMTWFDKSGGARHANSIGSIGGKYNKTICNGKPGVSFGSPGTNGLSVTAGGFRTAPLPKSPYVTVFFVFTPSANQNNTPAAIASPWAQATDAGDHYITRLTWPAASSMCLDGNTNVGTAKVSQLNGPAVTTLAAMTPPQPMLVTLVTQPSGTKLTCYANGLTDLPASNLSGTWASTPNPTGSAPVILGTDVGAQGESFLYGALSEVIHYNATLSTANIDYIQGYLANKWGLSAYLPKSHTYYDKTLTSIANGASAASYERASAAKYLGASTATYQGASTATYQGASTATYQGASSATYQGASSANYLRASAATYHGVSYDSIVTAGIPKTYKAGAKSISILGPATTKVGVSTTYKVLAGSGYPSWIGSDPKLSIHFIITFPSGSMKRVYSDSDTYKLKATIPGNYTIVGYALNLGECADETTCPVASMTVNVTGTLASTGVPNKTEPSVPDTGSSGSSGSNETKETKELPAEVEPTEPSVQTEPNKAIGSSGSSGSSGGGKSKRKTKRKVKRRSKSRKHK